MSLKNCTHHYELTASATNHSKIGRLFKRFLYIFYFRFYIQVIALSLLILPAACKEDEGDTVSKCKSDFSNLTISVAEDYIYSGEQVTLIATKLCTDTKPVIFVNDEVVGATSFNETSISFIIPPVSSDKVVIKIQSGDEVAELPKVLSFYPGTGTWREVAEFPGVPRVRMQTFAKDNAAYFVGGLSFERVDGILRDVFYKDLYKFDIEANSWTLVATEDLFNETGYSNGSAAFANGSLYVKPVQNQIRKFSLSSNTFETIDTPPYYYQRWMFSLGNTLYSVSNKMDETLLIQSYNEVNNQWAIVKESDYTKLTNGKKTNFIITFVAIVGDDALIGVQYLNSREVDLLSFNSTTNTLLSKSKITSESPASFAGLRHLFTINDLSYFIEVGESSIGQNITVTIPNEQLYIYNHKLDHWKIIDNDFPETFYMTTSIGLANKGFCGFSASGGGSTFHISQKLWEFIPR